MRTNSCAKLNVKNRVPRIIIVNKTGQHVLKTVKCLSHIRQLAQKISAKHLQELHVQCRVTSNKHQVSLI